MSDAWKAKTKRKGTQVPSLWEIWPNHLIRRNCNEEARSNKLKVNKAEVRRRDSSSSDGDCVGLMVNHLFLGNSPGPLNDWIVDSGATCHMCCDDKLFDELHRLKQPLEVTLGDGYTVEATGRDTVVLELTKVGGKASRCKLHEVLSFLICRTTC